MRPIRVEFIIELIKLLAAVEISPLDYRPAKLIGQPGGQRAHVNWRP